MNDASACQFIEEFHPYLDLNTALKIANELGLENAVNKIFSFEEVTNLTDEKKLMLESFLSFGDAERSFELLRANPPNQLSLVLRSMSRLLELDTVAAIKLFISMYPHMTVRSFSFFLSFVLSFFRSFFFLTRT